jgi:hypothetical protein
MVTIRVKGGAIMADLAELEARIKRLEDIEAIKRLRHKYFRCLDGKLWDQMEDCFAEDVKTSYSTASLRPTTKLKPSSSSEWASRTLLLPYTMAIILRLS